ncbi:hypothetical protein AZH53_09090 [Methanomicrobiaceae archaeon CYW5]|nr:hypothetical protein [Methanovulcanius yangii]
MALFSDIATSFLEAPAGEGIYDLIADAVTTLCPGCYVMVSRIEEEKRLLSLQALGGNPEVIQKFLGDLGMEGLTAVVSLPQERINALKKETVITVPPSLASVTNHFIPAGLCKKFDRVLDIGTIRIISFVWKGRLYGAAPIICPRGACLPEPTVLKAFARMVSVSLQRLEAESQLILAEKKYRTLADHASAIILQTDENLIIRYANRHAVERLGWGEEELVGSSFADLIAYEENDDTGRKEHLQRAIREGERDLEGEQCFTSADGDRICLAWRASLGYGDDGSFTWLSWTALDVTDARRSERALRESREQLRMVTDGSFDGIISSDIGGTITYASPSSERILGIPMTKILGANCIALFPPDRQGRAEQIFAKIVAGEVFEGIRFPYRRPDGSEILVELNSGPIFRDDKSVGAMAVVRDISAMERAQRAELEVQYTTSLLSASLRNTPLGMALFHLTADGVQVADWNHSMAKILGWQPEEIVGKMLGEVIPVRVADAIYDALAEIAWFQRPGVVRSLCGTATGQRVNLNWFHNPFTDPRDGEQYVMSLAEDMTEVEQARRALEDSEKQYRRTIDALAELVFVVDRELRVRVSNRAFTRWLENLGHRGEITGRTITDVLPFSTTKECTRIEQVFALAEPLDTVEEVSLGEIHWIMAVNRVPVIRNGTVVEVAVLMRDITAVHELEILKREAFEQIERNMEQFAILNDHIRNPLQGILGICELDGIEHYDLIYKHVKEIDAIIRRLDIGYLESEKIREFLRKHYGMLDA